MQAVFLLLYLEENPALDAVRAPGRPLVQNLPHAHHPGHSRDEDVEIAGEAVLQGCQPEQLLHQLLRVNAPLQVDGQLQAAQIRLVPHVGNLFDFPRLDQLRHLVHDDFRGGGVGNFRNFNEIAVLDVAPFCPEPEASTACGIDFPCGGFVKQQLPAGGKIRAGQGLQNVVVGIFHQGNGGVAHFPQVKRADVGRHAHGDALVGRNQHVGECGGQQRRLLHGGVVVVHHVHGVAVDVLEHLGADGIQLGLGVPGGGVGHVPGVHLAEVALGIHKGMQQRLIALGKTHHGLIDGGVAVGVQAHGLADDVGGLRPSAGEQTHFVHGIQ